MLAEIVFGVLFPQSLREVHQNEHKDALPYVGSDVKSN